MASVKTPLASFAPNIAPHINTFGTSQERDTIVLEKPQPNTQSSDKSPTTLGTKRKMSFGVGSFNSPNGMPHGINYGGPNGSRISQPTYSPKTAAPSIYTVCLSSSLCLIITWKTREGADADHVLTGCVFWNISLRNYSEWNCSYATPLGFLAECYTNP